MKKSVALLLAILLMLGCIGCGAEKETPEPTAEPTQEVIQKTERTASQAGMDALNGKSILFVGNSYTYFGRAVTSKNVDDSNQLLRTGDDGYFYHLCKAMGMEVTVTNWTFGGHDLTDSLGSSCTHKHAPGTDHLSYLTDRYFDYVALQLYKEDEYAGDLNAHLQPLMDIFREFGAIRHLPADTQEAQALVKKLQDYITAHYYTCTKQILRGLGQMYVADERFKANIDRAGGEGTAEFVAKAIEIYCK